MLEIDVRGLACPMPVLRLRKSLVSIGLGEKLRLIVTDKSALRDIPLFCQQMGHSVREVQESDAGGEWVFIIEKQA